jgi:hypothetical protein
MDDNNFAEAQRLSKAIYGMKKIDIHTLMDLSGDSHA